MKLINIKESLSAAVIAAVSAVVTTMLFSLNAIAADDIQLKPIKVSEHVYYFHGASGVASSANQGFMSNAGFVVTADGVVVYDALATPVLGQAMISAIRSVSQMPMMASR